jgi:hypothetical protein
MPDRTVYNDIAANFDAFIRAADPFVATVLIGHLSLEELLERILKTYLAADELLDDARLTFQQKAVLARGLTAKNTDSKTWTMILKINRLRNEIGHNLAPNRSGPVVDELRLLLREIDIVAFDSVPKCEDDHAMVIGATNFCIGFLGSYLRERSVDGIKAQDRGGKTP